MQGYINAPKAPLASNFRPIQPLNQRILRTNIDFKKNTKSQVNSRQKNRAMDGEEEDGERVRERERWAYWVVE